MTEVKSSMIKQEPDPSTADTNQQPVPLKFSTSVTTGQGGGFNYNWPSSSGSGSLVSARLGNNRAPIPTCGIAVARATPNIMMRAPEGDGKKSSGALVADAMLGTTTEGRQENFQCSSESLESAQDNLQVPPASDFGSLIKSEASDLGSGGEELDDGQDDSDEDTPRSLQQSKNGLRSSRKGKEKKRVGRPLAYKGDPNAPELTEQERRRIKRRIANRESARRVRHKRQEVLEEMQSKMEQLQAHNLHLVRHAHEVEGQKAQLYSQLVELESKYKQTIEENGKMHHEVHALRQSLQLKMTVLEEELDKRAKEAESPTSASAFSTAPMMDQPRSTECRMVQQPMVSTMMDTSGGELGKAPLEWFPSLNLDDMPPRGEAWDMLNTFLKDEPQSQGREAVC